MGKVQHKTLEGLLLKTTAPNLLGPERPVSQNSSPTSLPWSLRPAEPSSDVKEPALPSPRPTSHLTPRPERLTFFPDIHSPQRKPCPQRPGTNVAPWPRQQKSKSVSTIFPASELSFSLCYNLFSKIK
uniref:Uncharacterized protein n=1 Tax=Rousettus aegyptiacus TaxID=9407 RepID=A0A7J8DI14_ROUAE|nr:hypothetical protein HJG63_008672 [Rousettus aegyptiacus]